MTGVESPISGQPRRSRALDVLRGVAVLLVLGRHMGGVPLDAPYALQVLLDVWVRAGWIGVDLFFVLSGYLVSGLIFRDYERTGAVHAGRFLLRRGLRIYPAFYFFLVATSLATGTIATREFAAEATFTQNYFSGLWDHTWSLAIEEHFYLLLAVLLLLLAARGDRAGKRQDPFAAIVPLFAVVGATEIALRVLTALYGRPSFVHHLYPTHLRIDSLLFGTLLSYLAWSRGDRLWPWVAHRRPVIVLAAISSLAPALFLPATNPFMETAGFTLLYLGFGCVLLLAVGRERDLAALGSERQTPPMPVHQGRTPGVQSPESRVQSLVSTIGFYSYSIYLWHLAVKRWLVPAIDGAVGLTTIGLASFLIYLVASALTGILLARLIEVPALALRDRWFPEIAERPASRVLGREAAAVASR